MRSKKYLENIASIEARDPAKFNFLKTVFEEQGYEMRRLLIPVVDLTTGRIYRTIAAGHDADSTFYQSTRNKVVSSIEGECECPEGYLLTVDCFGDDVTHHDFASVGETNTRVLKALYKSWKLRYNQDVKNRLNSLSVRK